MHGVPSNLREFCEWLGDDPDEVADTLASLGCDGHPTKMNSCPVAVAIRKYVNTWAGAKVTKSQVQFGDSQIMDYWLPIPVRRFIKNFDHNEYPFLVSTNEVSL